MDNYNIFKEDATVFVMEIISDNHSDWKEIKEDIYECNGKKMINSNSIEVKKLMPMEKLYYKLDHLEGSVWREIETFEMLSKIFGYYEDTYEAERIKRLTNNYYDWQNLIKKYDQYNILWSNILVSDIEDFELIKDVFQTYAPFYCYSYGDCTCSDQSMTYLLQNIRKVKVENRMISYELFEDMYLKDRISALETLFQEPITEEHLSKLDKRSFKDETIKDLYDIVKIYPYIRIEECLKGNKTFKTIYIELKNKIESMQAEEILNEVPFDDVEVDNESINKQSDLELEELINTDDIKKDFKEGKQVYRTHRIRERNPKVIKESKKLFKKKNNGRLFCEVCGFDFEKVYGERGKNFIEAHHEKPVSEMNEGDSTKIEDIRMVCSNCHKIIHRQLLITIEELRAIIVEQQTI